MSQEVIIAGGGVIGLCSALYAAEAGHKVTIIERNGPSRDGCSLGNAGMIVPSHFIPLAAPGMVALGLKWMWNPESPFYIKPRLSADLISWAWKFWRAATKDHVRKSAPLLRDLSLASRALYEALDDSGLDFGLEKRGLLMLCKSQHGLDEEAVTAAKANELGIPAEVLDAKQTAALDPNVTMDIQGSVYFPKDCQLVPGRFMTAVQERCEALGVRFLWNTSITGWKTEGGRIVAVKIGNDEISGDQFVLSGGSWSPEMLQGLKLNLPMQAGKGYSLTLKNPVELSSICSIFTEARIAVTPMDGGMRFGGTMEVAGLNEDITKRRVQGIINAIPAYYPKFKPSDFADIQPWRGLRPCSPDGLPYLGRTAAVNNLIVATGHAMMGLSLAPISGKIVANLLSGEPAGQDLTMLSPDRY